MSAEVKIYGGGPSMHEQILAVSGVALGGDDLESLLGQAGQEYDVEVKADAATGDFSVEPPLPEGRMLGFAMHVSGCLRPHFSSPGVVKVMADYYYKPLEVRVR